MKQNNKKKMLTKYVVSFVAALFTMFMVGAVANAAEGEGTTAIKLDKYSALDTQSTDASTGMVSGTFQADVSALDTVSSSMHKIVCPEDGYYRINYSGLFRGEEGITRNYDNNSAKITLCANELGTKVIDEPVEIGLDDPTFDKFIELTKGTYYLLVEPKINNTEKNIDTTYGVSFGYLPKNTSFIQVKKTVNVAAKKVVLTVNGLDAEKLQIKSGLKTGSDVYFGILWEDCPEIAAGGSYDITAAGADGYYTIRMVDKYDNVYGLPVRITEFDTPANPVIRVYKSGTTVVSGTSVPNGTLKVQVGSKSYSNVKANSKGAWSVKTTRLKVGTAIKASVVSQFGKASHTVTVSVKNQTLKKPKVTKAKKNTKKVIGTAKAKSTVYVKIGNKTYKAKANAKGKFTVKTKKLKKKMKLTIYAKDAVGNTSKKVSYKVK